MSKVSINETTLTAIGDAIREKTGKTDLIAPGEMPAEIKAIETGGGELPEEALVLTKNCSSKFCGNNWNWFINTYGDKITTKDITSAEKLFYESDTLTTIPFDFNFDSVNASYATMMFAYCGNLTSIGKIVNFKVGQMSGFFQACYRLRVLPEFINLDTTTMNKNTTANLRIFNNCYSLRSIPEDLLKRIYTTTTSTYSHHFYDMFTNDASLDEIRGLSPQGGQTLTSNVFQNTFSQCARVKEIIFDTQEDGTPYAVKWKSQTISLTGAVGNCLNNLMYRNYMISYNSGITTDKEVKDDATYQALKNDADWYTLNAAYSRYNHDSAVNTINSLPDASAYLATAGGTNTIQFRGAAGELTDGGAINTLTEEEIAVATAKGWTVTLV